MTDEITSAFSETTEQITSSSPYKILFIVLVIILFLAINNIIIYLIYIKLRNVINNYCEQKIKNMKKSPTKT
jgi:hypothetical protein